MCDDVCNYVFKMLGNEDRFLMINLILKNQNQMLGTALKKVAANVKIYGTPPSTAFNR